VIKVLSWLGLVWDLREPPAHVVRGELPIGRKVLERVARELATSFAPERIADQIRSSWAHKPTLEEIVHRIRVAGVDLGNHASDELGARTSKGKEEARARIASLSVPHLPTLEELRARAEHMFNGAPSLEIVVARAREMLEEAVSMALLEPAFSGS
jgi:stearoyl-CoA desaturase (delta-9 desaturase)